MEIFLDLTCSVINQLILGTIIVPVITTRSIVSVSGANHDILDRVGVAVNMLY